jgi:outer membrane lipoprotein carrier protein
MRKFLSAVAVLVGVTAIALMVRPQLREDTRTVAPEVAVEPASPAISGEPAIHPADSALTAPAPAVTPVRNTPKPMPPVPVAIDEEPKETAVDVDAASQDGAAILKRASVAYGKVKAMRADFVQRRENPLLNSNTTSRGTLYQKSPDRFALKFSQPAGDVIIADGRYFWVYYPSVDRRQVIRANATEGGAGAVDLQAQFIGDPVKRFKYTYEGSQKLGGRTVHILTLVPRSDAGYKSMKVWIDGMDSLVRRFQINENSGTVVEFQLSNLSVNPLLGNDIFQFTPPAGAQVIER